MGQGRDHPARSDQGAPSRMRRWSAGQGLWIEPGTAKNRVRLGMTGRDQGARAFGGLIPALQRQPGEDAIAAGKVLCRAPVPGRCPLTTAPAAAMRAQPPLLRG
jgi:hypothetical protein